jgi:hypothetical protein
MVVIDGIDFRHSRASGNMASFLFRSLAMYAQPAVFPVFRALVAALLLTLLLASLGGCASSRPALLADQSAAQQIECPGLFGSWQGCRAEALNLCGGSYQVLSRNQHEGASEDEVEALVAEAAYRQRSMLVRCADQGRTS